MRDALLDGQDKGSLFIANCLPCFTDIKNQPSMTARFFPTNVCRKWNSFTFFAERCRGSKPSHALQLLHMHT